MSCTCACFLSFPQVNTVHMYRETGFFLSSLIVTGGTMSAVAHSCLYYSAAKIGLHLVGDLKDNGVIFVL